MGSPRLRRGRFEPRAQLRRLPLEDVAGLRHEPREDRQLLNRVDIEQPPAVGSQWRPDALDPGTRVLGELDASAVARLEARVARELQPLERRGDDAALQM